MLANLEIIKGLSVCFDIGKNGLFIFHLSDWIEETALSKCRVTDDVTSRPLLKNCVTNEIKIKNLIIQIIGRINFLIFRL